MTQYVKEKVENLENPITAWALLGIIIGLVIMYGIFINGIIGNTVAAKDLQSKVATLTTSVSSLESTYLGAKSEVTLESALAMGFEPSPSDTIYVSRANGASLSFNR